MQETEGKKIPPPKKSTKWQVPLSLKVNASVARCVVLSLTLVALPSPQLQVGSALAGGAAALGVGGVLLIDGVQQQARGGPWQVGVPGLSDLLLGGLAEPFLLVTGGPHVTTITEVQGPVQSVIDERTELFEVIIVMAPVAHTHLDARVACEAAVSARRLVFAVGEGTALLRAILF